MLSVELCFIGMWNEECWMGSCILLEWRMRNVEWGIVFYYNNEWEMWNVELCFIGMWNEECGMSSYILMNNGLIHNYFYCNSNHFKE